MLHVARRLDILIVVIVNFLVMLNHLVYSISKSIYFIIIYFITKKLKYNY
jgi:hypothetical protein